MIIENKKNLQKSKQIQVFIFTEKIIQNIELKKEKLKILKFL